jgi:hypothetical protein
MLDGRVERREEREALTALREEFTASLQAMEQSRQLHRSYADATRRLLQWTGPNPTLPAGDTVSATLERALGFYSSYNDQRGVLDGIIASGGLRLIQNDSLRAMLAGWPAVVEDMTEDEVVAIQFRNTTLLPYVYQRLPVTGSKFPRDLRALFADPYFERLLDWRARQVELFIMPPYETALRDLRRIQSTIDEELGSGPSVPVGRDLTRGSQDTTRRGPR